MNDSGKACGATFKEGSAVLTGKEYFAGYSYTCSYSVPQYENVNEYALIVTFDGMNAQVVQVMARLYEEGIALVRECNEKLDSAEQKIKLLTAEKAQG